MAASIRHRAASALLDCMEKDQRPPAPPRARRTPIATRARLLKSSEHAAVKEEPEQPAKEAAPMAAPPKRKKLKFL